ncbi:MAG: ComEC/Rec2 family competence protein [Candidatus Paceibacterota bacterium]|jgi:competence protein ComEC
MNPNKLYIFVIGFALGILFRSFFNLGWSVIIFLALISVIVFLLHFLFKETQKPAFFIAIFLIALSLGILRFHISDLNNGDQVLNNSINSKVSLIGTINDEPDQRDKNIKLEVKLENVVVENKEILVNSKALITTEMFPTFYYGDRIQINGTLKIPSNFENENGQTFDYVSYLRKDGIFYQINYPKIEIISRGNGNFIMRGLLGLKNGFLNIISRTIPDPEASFMGGILLGTKQSLGDDLKQDFVKTGTIHVIALSGYNVTIVAENIMKFFGFLPITLSIYFGIGAIILFALMTGAGATVIRASLMAILVLVARLLGRSSNITRAIFIVGFLMLLQNPWILAFDVSFQLSFLATIGIIYLTPRVEKHLMFLPKKFGLRELVSATLATQFFVLPFILYKMGILSIVSLPANLLILPFIPATMLFGLLTGVFGFVSTILAFPFSSISYLLLHYELFVVKFLASLGFSSITINKFPLILVLIIYLALGFYLLKPYLKSYKVESMPRS